MSDKGPLLDRGAVRLSACTASPLLMLSHWRYRSSPPSVKAGAPALAGPGIRPDAFTNLLLRAPHWRTGAGFLPLRHPAAREGAPATGIVLQEGHAMNPQERDVINGIFDRLKQAEGQPRDPEADALIQNRLAAQPGAAYLLAQIVHVQEQALTSLNDRVNALETEVAEAREAAAAAPAAGGGFLSSLFGASTPPARQAQPAPRPAARQQAGGQQAGGPWGRQGGAQGGPWAGQGAQPGPWGNQGGGGGFLASAMTTAVGVAGGLVLGNVLANAFGLNGGSAEAASDPASAAAEEPATQDTADAGEFETGHDDATYQDASYDESLDGGFDDFSDGGGDDWA
jgi:hypothetical protein